MTLKDEILAMLNASKNGLTIDAITRKSSLTNQHSRVGNVLSSLQKNGDAHMNGEGVWFIGKSPEQMDLDDAIKFLDTLAANFSGVARDVTRVRDLLKRSI